METAIRLDNVSKTFGKVKAVNGVSFDVKRGEIFGLIGPNGSGKTTIIRMILGILGWDGGKISVFGGKPNGVKRDLLGYLPEERGLYSDLTVGDTLGYFASLKGVSSAEGVARANELLLDLGQLLDFTKKIKELSHGMAQLVQLVVAIIHNPDLVIFDEPFSGLDPIRRELFKGMIQKLSSEGKSVLLSTHQMGEVEALCGRILMISEGANILYGDLKDIKEKHSKGIIRIDVVGELGILKGVAKVYEQNGYRKLLLAEGVMPEDILMQLLDKKLKVKEFAVELPMLQEIFIDLAGGI